MKSFTATVLIASTGLMASFSYAHADDASVTDPYFQIQEPTVTELSADDIQALNIVNPTPTPVTPVTPGTPIVVPPAATPPPASGAIGDVLGSIVTGVGQGNVILTTIINMGKAVWAIVDANKPVATFTADSANALPQGLTDWAQIEGWQAPLSHYYKVSYKNGFGSDVIDFTFRIIYTSGGNVGGKGLYLASVTMVPADLNVSWGYKFGAAVKIPTVSNSGTRDNPIAAMQIQLQWTVDTTFQHQERTEEFYVQGNGNFQHLN